jgi:signal transduction histidine kinase
MFHTDHQVEQATRRVQANAAPAVRHMAAIRKAMIHLAVCAPAPTQSTAEIAACTEAAQRQIAAELKSYEGLPEFSDSRTHLADVRRAVTTLDGRIAELRATIGSPARFDAAMEATLATLDPLTEALDRLSQDTLREVLRPSSQVSSLLHQSELMELLLSGTAVLIAVVATIHGVRATRRYHRFLQARADELEAFSATVAHDLLSPLASLGIAMPVIQYRHPDDAETQRLTSRALSSVKRVHALVDGLLDYARAGGIWTGTRAEVRQVLGDVVGDLSEQAAAARVEIVVERADGAAACSPAVLSSILSNLVSNALKYLGDAEDRRVRVRAAPRGNRLRVEVEDAGPGVPLGLVDAVFEPYVRVPGSGKPGFGLGLATVKRLVAAHNGDVGVCRGERAGSIFWFELPLVADNRQTSAPKSSEPSPPHVS